MINADATKKTFDELVRQAESFLEGDDWAVLKSYGKDEAVSRLHLTVGARIRDELGLWGDGSPEKLQAILAHANQGMLLGFDADGGSSALLEYLWDRLHVAIVARE